MVNSGDRTEDVLKQPERVARQALRELGTFAVPVREFVRRANRIHWMAHAGNPTARDGDLVRVSTLEAAKGADEAFAPLLEAGWEAIEGLGKAARRFDVMLAAEDYWIVRFNPLPRSERSYADPFFAQSLSAQINTALVGALRELILDDVVSVRFFREIVDWYESGHWMCGIDPAGRRIVW